MQVADQRRFGDLKLQPARCETGLEKNLVNRMSEIYIVDLHRRNVDCNGQRLFPCRRLFTGCPQYPLTDRKNTASVFGNGNEIRWGDVAPRGVFPAQQCFDADNFSCLNVGLRLVDELQFLAGDCISQIVLHQATVAQHLAHRGFEKTIGTPTFILGTVEGRIGMREQGLPVRCIIGADRNADAGCNVSIGLSALA